jgi:hypothetical protein
MGFVRAVAGYCSTGMNLTIRQKINIFNIIRKIAVYQINLFNLMEIMEEIRFAERFYQFTIKEGEVEEADYAPPKRRQQRP